MFCMAAPKLVAAVQSIIEYGPLVKRLRHRPFTAVTGVRFPYGSPSKTGTPKGVLVFDFAI